ncbi:hypothetical protein TNCV_1653231 [Trichonephila clavipes]|nr:hypothetical protein TNCV_1653231 [Trichonephila clavipes]
MVSQRLTHLTTPAATPDQLWQRVEAAWSAVPQEHIQSLLESIPRFNLFGSDICSGGQDVETAEHVLLYCKLYFCKREREGRFSSEPTGGRFQLWTDLTYIAALHGGSLVVLGSNL